MIHGIGTDLVRVARLESTLRRHGDRFARRILAAEEYADYTASALPARFLAKRFAAKEAAAKALGTGIRDGLRLAHLVVRNDRRGRPSLELRERAAELARELRIVAAHLSLSDEGEYALAYVVLERAEAY